MDIQPPGTAGAIAAARAEARQWAEISAHWSGFTDAERWNDVAPREHDVVRFFDPAPDLDMRAESWNHRFTDHDLADVARFAAGLAAAEADAWRDDQPHIATRAFADRRFLVGDRILPWAVPWLDTTGRCHPDLREVAHSDRDMMLSIGDFHRPAPDLGRGREGMYLPGHDSLGPVAVADAPAAWASSLWSGAIVMRATMESMTGAGRDGPGVVDADLRDADLRDHLAMLFSVTAARWRNMAEAHPGAATLWLDLATRAVATSSLLAALR